MWCSIHSGSSSPWNTLEQPVRVLNSQGSSYRSFGGAWRAIVLFTSVTWLRIDGAAVAAVPTDGAALHALDDLPVYEDAELLATDALSYSYLACSVA